MKRFVVTVTAYILALGLIVSSVNWLYVSMGEDDPYGVSAYKQMPDNIQVCNLGSSHGRRGFDYSGHPDIVSFNFAFTAQSLTYDYRILYNYQDHLAPGCVVYIPVSYFSFFGKSETELADFMSKNERYYHILPRELIREYDLLSYFCTVVFPAVGAGTDMFKVFLGGNGEPEQDITLITADTIDLENAARSAYRRHLVDDRQDENGDLLLLEDEVQSLYAIIELCKEIGARPVLVTTPYLAEYTDLVLENQPEFLPYFYSLVQKVSEDTQTPYWDYAFDQRFQHDYSLFMDSDHLNKSGALSFTEILLRETR